MTIASVIIRITIHTMKQRSIKKYNKPTSLILNTCSLMKHLLFEAENTLAMCNLSLISARTDCVSVQDWQ